MTSMTRFGLAVLFVVGVALCTSSPAWAQSPLELTNTTDANDPDYGASGTATLTHQKLLYSDEYGAVMSAQLVVQCELLTPGATYLINGRTFTADRNGSLEKKLGYVRYYSGDGPSVEVSRLNPDGSSTLVLSGSFLW